jgi:hypothetical protein
MLSNPFTILTTSQYRLIRTGSLDILQVITLLVVLTLSLVVPSVYGAGPMDEEPFTLVSPSTTSTPVSPLTTGPVCENKQLPTVAEKCRTTAGVYMGIDHNGDVVFSSDIADPFEKISVYSVVQKNFEQRKKDFEYGMYTGYRLGFDDGFKGRSSNPEYNDPEEYEAIKQGFRLGYPDGYAAGVFEKNFKDLRK